MITVRRQFQISRSQLGRKWRVENNNLDLSALAGTSGYEAVRVGEIGRTHREERDKRKTANASFRYVEIGDIDVALGRIRSYRTYTGLTAPNNARRLMKEGDILVSTRRPTRGAIVAVPPTFDGHICSVFFSSIRLHDPAATLPDYVALCLRTSLGRFQFQSMITETAYPVIGDDDVENVFVFLPDVSVQRRLVADYAAAVESYFALMNEAHSTLVRAQQDVETLVLGSHAETIVAPTFGLTVETEAPEDGVTGEGEDPIAERDEGSAQQQALF